jgi:hypothetical protein
MITLLYDISRNNFLKFIDGGDGDNDGDDDGDQEQG